MLLFELMDKPANWKQTKDDKYDNEYRFTLPDGREIIVDIAYDMDNYGGTPMHDVSFHVANADQATQYKKTNEGGELIVFATVLEIMSDYLSKFPDHILTFSASTLEANRVSLYNRMVKRYIKPPMAYKVAPKYGEYYIGHQDLINDVEV